MAQDLRAFMVSQAANIEAEVYEAKYASIQYPDLAPVVTEGSEWALSVERRTMDGAGTAGDISSLADDFPNVDVQYQRLTQEVHGAGASYTVAEDEAAIAMMGGFNISADKARTARRLVEERLDSKFFAGDATRKWDSFNRVALPGATSLASTAASTGSGNAAHWSNTAKTANSIVNDINNAIGRVFTETRQVHLPNTLALPTKSFVALSAKQITNTTMTALSWIRENNSYTAQTGNPLTIIAVHALTNTAIVYDRDPDVVRFHLPMPTMVRGPQLDRAGMSMTYYLLARTGGCEWRIPRAADIITAVEA